MLPVLYTGLISSLEEWWRSQVLISVTVSTISKPSVAQRPDSLPSGKAETPASRRNDALETTPVEALSFTVGQEAQGSCIQPNSAPLGRGRTLGEGGGRGGVHLWGIAGGLQICLQHDMHVPNLLFGFGSQETHFLVCRHYRDLGCEASISLLSSPTHNYRVISTTYTFLRIASHSSITITFSPRSHQGLDALCDVGDHRSGWAYTTSFCAENRGQLLKHKLEGASGTQDTGITISYHVQTLVISAIIIYTAL